MSSFPPPPPPPPPVPPQGAAPGPWGLAPGAVSLRLDPPGEMDRWRPFLQWILAIPHLMVAYAVGVLANVLRLVALVTVLFTRHIPDGVYGALIMAMRYQTRTIAYASALHDRFPPFSFATTPADPGDTPLRLDIGAQPAEYQRFAPLYKWFLAIPHYLALIVLGFGAFFVWIAAAFTVLFTGRFPDGMHRYLVGVHRWSTRVNAYVGLLNDDYPPFTLD